jgi:Uma2 family endonuclease
MTMTMLVLDRHAAQDYLSQRRASGNDRWDEVWDGVYILMPNPNIEHQGIAGRLMMLVLGPMVEMPGRGQVFPGVNVSDRFDDWTKNYRCPDIAVYLEGNPAQPRGSYWYGGPDFAVEIVSPDDRSRDKFGFYARVGVRELLLIDREPWALELYRNQGAGLALAGASTLDDPRVLTSGVLPLAFRLVPGAMRPDIEVTHSDGVQRWTV